MTMAWTSEAFPTLVLFGLAVALLITPPTGHDTILPTSMNLKLAKSPMGNAFWTPPASSHWPSFSPNKEADESRYLQSHESQSPTLSSQSMKEDSLFERKEKTAEFHLLISQQSMNMDSVLKARELLSLPIRNHDSEQQSNITSCLVDCSLSLSVPHMRPQGVMVRLMDIYDELSHHNQALLLMRDYINCGGDANPIEPESGIDVLTRAVSLGSLRAVSLIVATGGKVKVLKF